MVSFMGLGEFVDLWRPAQHAESHLLLFRKGFQAESEAACYYKLPDAGDARITFVLRGRARPFFGREAAGCLELPGW
jgi:hypothetical protein